MKSGKTTINLVKHPTLGEVFVLKVKNSSRASSFFIAQASNDSETLTLNLSRKTAVAITNYIKRISIEKDWEL